MSIRRFCLPDIQTKMETIRKCLECGEVLHGRSDQKYCNDQCRNTFNNRLSGETNNHIRRINRILKRNQPFLSVLNTKGRTTIKRDELLKKEFDFNYFTNLITTRYGRVYYFCYDQGYSPIDGKKVLLIYKEMNKEK